jgi:hypothetical protein
MELSPKPRMVRHRYGGLRIVRESEVRFAEGHKPVEPWRPNLTGESAKRALRRLKAKLRDEYFSGRQAHELTVTETANLHRAAVARYRLLKLGPDAPVTDIAPWANIERKAFRDLYGAP